MQRYILLFLVGTATGSGGFYVFTGQGTETVPTIGDAESITVASFNIQFLGNSPTRDDEALAELVRDVDIVLVQELVSPPYAGTFPGGDAFNPDAESAEFFDAMNVRGFEYVLSEEDTGTGDVIHRNGSTTEWWVAFYNPNRVQVASDLPSGFLAADRSNHDDYERVPYAFPFRTPDGSLDFVLISVHLKPNPGPANRARRKEEIDAIAAWIADNDDDETDFIIVGDMNFQNKAELINATPPGFLSLNNQFLPTNTQLDESYDHVMVNLYNTSEVDLAFGFVVIDLVASMAEPWAASNSGPYPGEPYDHDPFRGAYSDHNPVVFKLMLQAADDDG